MYISEILSSGASDPVERRGVPMLRAQDQAAAPGQALNLAGPGSFDRRAAPSGRLGSRRTDRWMPYFAPFVAQLLAQMDDQKR